MLFYSEALIHSHMRSHIPAVSQTHSAQQHSAVGLAP